MTKRRQPELTARRTRCGSALSAPFLPRLAREVNTSPFHQLIQYLLICSRRRIFAPTLPNFLCLYSTNLVRTQPKELEGVGASISRSPTTVRTHPTDIIRQARSLL